MDAARAFGGDADGESAHQPEHRGALYAAAVSHAGAYRRDGRGVSDAPSRTMAPRLCHKLDAVGGDLLGGGASGLPGLLQRIGRKPSGADPGRFGSGLGPGYEPSGRRTTPPPRGPSPHELSVHGRRLALEFAILGCASAI